MKTTLPTLSEFISKYPNPDYLEDDAGNAYKKALNSIENGGFKNR